MINRSIHKLGLGVLALCLVLLALYATSRTVISPTHPNPVSTPTPTMPQVQHTPTATLTVTNVKSSPISPLQPISPVQPTVTAVALSPLTSSSIVTPARYTYTVVKTYPHDPTAWTEGLFFNEGALYEGTGENGHSFVRKIDLESGKVLQQISLPEKYYGEGIVIFGDRLYQLTYQTQIGFIYNKATFALLKTFTYPTEGWGLTHDDTRLIMSDGSARLTYRDPETLHVIGYINVSDPNGPISQLNELEYIKDEIYANIWTTNFIAIISPQTGKIRAYIDLTDLLPQADRANNQWLNGIAYLPKDDRLFVTGKHWPKLFEIRLIAKAIDR